MASDSFWNGDLSSKCMRAIWGKTDAYLNFKVWSTNGDVFLSKAAKAGLWVRCHSGKSEEAVLRWASLKMGEGQAGGDSPDWDTWQRSQCKKAEWACPGDKQWLRTECRGVRISLKPERSPLPHSNFKLKLIQEPTPLPSTTFTNTFGRPPPWACGHSPCELEQAKLSWPVSLSSNNTYLVGWLVLKEILQMKYLSQTPLHIDTEYMLT